VFEDSDLRDMKKCELWSSIDGLLNETTISKIDQKGYNYNYNHMCYNLSEGIHTITFKVFDEDGEYTEESVELVVEEYIYGFLPKKYDWTLFIAIIAVFLEILLRSSTKEFLNEKVTGIVLAFLILLVPIGYLSMNNLIFGISLISLSLIGVKFIKYRLN
jgi:hypothetical protein